MDNRYRTQKETIEYLKRLEFAFECDAHREPDEIKRAFLLGKAEAYHISAFEIEHNMRREHENNG